MLQTMQNSLMKKKNKKGFTLVEVIVVLVILAILAAILVPTMIGYINKAEKKSVIVEARAVLLASQTVVSENYKTTATGTAGAVNETLVKEIEGLAEVTTGSVKNLKVDTNGAVDSFTYEGTKYKVDYTKA
ncbi:MAG: prepilin-type N-terminal cleavage/methylation domain-containing protein, partial [Anaerovoracaceae bacterium]